MKTPGPPIPGDCFVEKKIVECPGCAADIELRITTGKHGALLDVVVGRVSDDS